MIRRRSGRRRLLPPLLVVVHLILSLGNLLHVGGGTVVAAFSFHRHGSSIPSSLPIGIRRYFNDNRLWRRNLVVASSFPTTTTTTTGTISSSSSSTRLYNSTGNTKNSNQVNATTRKQFASRFNGTSPDDTTIDTPCLLTIDNKVYDVQAFAKAHPGGSKILQKFHNRDATLAFENAGHSQRAREMLQEYEVVDHKDTAAVSTNQQSSPSTTPPTTTTKRRTFWKQKLFTDEDPIGYHKYLGIFCLLHYIFRYGQIVASGPSGAAVTNFVKSKYLAFWLLPHFLLNASSFIFHTVPKERIVGSPMIWKEYRVHNLIFVTRSILCTLLLNLSLNATSATAVWKRKIAVVGSVMAILASNVGADITTHYLQPTQGDSSVGTLPFWKDCSSATQQRFKLFYAYCQFMATMACLMVSYPLWPLAVMMPIQFSSILLTLTRKSLLSAKGWHVAYLVSLLFPFVAAAYPTFINPISNSMICWDAPIAFLAGTTLFLLRCWGVSKYWLWGILGSLRIVFGDQFIRYDIW